MRVLLTSRLENPNQYIDNLFRGIAKYAEVVCSSKNFWYSNLSFDIVHIQWPEELLECPTPSDKDVNKVVNRILYWKNKGAKIVCTYHNELPHRGLEIDNLLYYLVFQLADGIVHLGKYSISLFKKKYSDLENIKHIVIEHLLYEDIIPSINKETARKKLKLRKKDKIILVPGNIRNKEEHDMILAAFNVVKTNASVKLVFTSGYDPLKKISIYEYPVKRLLGEMFKWSRKKVMGWKGVSVSFGIKSSLDLILYVKSSDIIIIPRIRSLNSGVLYLAKSFSKIIVGPQIGNIYEHLPKERCYPFQPLIAGSLVNALDDSIKLAYNSYDSEKIIGPREFKESIDHTGKSHYLFYERLLATHGLEIGLE